MHGRVRERWRDPNHVCCFAGQGGVMMAIVKQITKWRSWNTKCECTCTGEFYLREGYKIDRKAEEKAQIKKELDCKTSSVQ